MNEPKIKRWASAKKNNDFICICTWSGYRASSIDLDGKQYCFPLDVSGEELGAAIKDALASSRFFTKSAARDFFNPSKVKERHHTWKKYLIERYCYKSHRDLYKNMRSCGIVQVDGQITISHTRQDRMDSWSGDRINPNDYEIHSETTSNEELGLALKRAFDKCLTR